MLSMLGGRNWSPILPLDSRSHCALLAAPAQIMHNVQASRSLPARVERMRCPIKALQIWRAARLQHSSPVKIKRNPLGDNTVAWRSMHRHILLPPDLTDMPCVQVCTDASDRCLAWLARCSELHLEAQKLQGFLNLTSPGFKQLLHQPST